MKTLLILVVLVASLVSNIYACACCANAGTWVTHKERIIESDGAELGSLILPGLVDSDSGDANPEFTLPEKRIEGRSEGTRVIFDLFPPQGQSKSSFELAVTSSELFQVDMGPHLDFREPPLYGEIRLTGEFRILKGLKGITARSGDAILILQGEGNYCMDTSTMTKWILKFKLSKDGKTQDFFAFGQITHPTTK